MAVSEAIRPRVVIEVNTMNRRDPEEATLEASVSGELPGSREPVAATSHPTTNVTATKSRGVTGRTGWMDE
jgi:hypothetical protein